MRAGLTQRIAGEDELFVTGPSQDLDEQFGLVLEVVVDVCSAATCTVGYVAHRRTVESGRIELVDRRLQNAFAHPDPNCNKAGAIQLGVSFFNVGPRADPEFLLHQDTAATFNVEDTAECSTASTPWLMNFGDPASPAKGGELFGWAIGH